MPQTNPAPGNLQSASIDYDLRSMARVLLPALQNFYDSPEGQAAFEEWKKQHEQKKPKKQRKKKRQQDT